MTCGFVHIYTGAGKGKTTAALGLLLRAVGAGLRVYLGQFLKGRVTSELRMLQTRFPEVTVEQFGRPEFVITAPSAEDVDAAHQALQRFRQAMLSGLYDVLIADEIMVAIKLGLISVEDVVALLAEKPAAVELVLTGRDAPATLVELADVVTDMRCIKHYFDRGVAARPGIEF